MVFLIVSLKFAIGMKVILITPAFKSGKNNKQKILGCSPETKEEAVLSSALPLFMLSDNLKQPKQLAVYFLDDLA